MTFSKKIMIEDDKVKKRIWTRRIFSTLYGLIAGTQQLTDRLLVQLSVADVLSATLRANHLTTMIILWLGYVIALQ